MNIILDDVALDGVNSTKFLGAIINENLTWKKHIDAISKTISGNAGKLTKLKHYVPDNIFYTLYCTLFLPYINYSDIIWGSACKIYLDKIFKSTKVGDQNNINQLFKSHTGPLFFKHYNIRNIHDKYKLNIGIFTCMYKHHTISNQLPSKILDLLY